MTSAGGTTYHQILDIAVPMVLAYLSVPLMGFVDLGVVGHLDDAKYVAGVAIGTLFFSTTYFVFFFLRWSTTGLTAMLFGKPRSDAREHEIGETLARSAAIGLVAGTLVLLVHQPLLSLVMDAMHTSPEVREQALSYAGYRALGVPAVLVGYALTGWFVGAAAPKAVLAMTVLANVVNAVLAVFLVLTVGMAAGGSGLAAAVGDWSSVALGLVVLLRRHRRYFRGVALRRIADRQRTLAVLRSNLEISVKLVSTIAVMYGVLLVSGRLGQVVLAANALVLQLIYFASYVLDGIANACEALSGRAYERSDRATLRRVVIRCSVCALTVGIVFLVFYGSVGGVILDAMSDLSATRAQARSCLLWAAVLPIGMALAVVFEGVFVGTMRTAALRNCSLFGTGVFLAVRWPAARLLGSGGVWFAFLCYFLPRQAFAYVAYLRTMITRSWVLSVAPADS